MKIPSLLTGAVVVVALVIMAAASAPAAEPEKAAELAAAVQKAIETKDATALDKLVYWEGASEEGKAFFKLLLGTAMGIKVEHVDVSPLPEGKTGPATTMTVTHLLQIAGAEGEGPAHQMFPVGEKDGKLYLAAAKDAPAGFSK